MISALVAIQTEPGLRGVFLNMAVNIDPTVLNRIRPEAQKHIIFIYFHILEDI